MYKRTLLLLSALLYFVSFIYSQSLPGFHVNGRHLYDKCGERVILRGISNPNIWFDKTGATQYPEIEQTEANVVRIVWDTYGTSADLDAAIENCIDQEMIPMVELHDATGDWSKLQDCVDYWIREDITDVIREHEEYLLINIANECGGYSITNTQFTNGYTNAITSIRAAGIHVPLIIDGTDWGKNINILQSQGPGLIEADPDHNLLFSVHMWWPQMYGYTESDIVDEIAESVNMGLPLIVGEFSQMHGECSTDVITDQNSIEYTTIIRECQENAVGYIAWSWFGNCNPFWDMTTDGTYATLYDWGLDVAVTDDNSIQNTSVRPYNIVNGICNPSGNEQPESVNESLALQQNYPNPFGESTTIHYSLGQYSHVMLSVYNNLGEEILTLVNSKQLPGDHSLTFNGRDLAPGIYTYILKSDGYQLTRRMMILR
jgi:mannan endo-1,4-beta-mannosidase